MSPAAQTLLQVEHLAVDFADAGETVHAVRDVGFVLPPGGRIALLGESGSGKSVSMMAVAGLLTEMEDRLGFIIDDDEVDGELLETYGSLLAFAKAKLAGAGARA